MAPLRFPGRGRHGHPGHPRRPAPPEEPQQRRRAREGQGEREGRRRENGEWRPGFFIFCFLFFNHSLARLEMTQKFQLCHCENENRSFDPSTNQRQDKLVVEPQATVVFTFSVSECWEETLPTADCGLLLHPPAPLQNAFTLFLFLLVVVFLQEFLFAATFACGTVVACVAFSVVHLLIRLHCRATLCNHLLSFFLHWLFSQVQMGLLLVVLYVPTHPWVPFTPYIRSSM